MARYEARHKAGHQPRKKRSRRGVGIGVAALALMLGLTLPTLAQLPSSNFESSDGNLAVNTAGNFDWNHPIETIDCGTTAQIPFAGTNCGTDLAKSGSDNSFGQGSKEDKPVPTVVSGSIPPQKSDLTRFYVNKEKVGSIDFLYLAWERTNVLGSANMDFEFNQSSTPSTNGVTPVRTAGDILITFDFGGSGNPVLGLLKWVTTGATSQCFATNSLPCWGNRVDLSAAGFADGAVNSVTVHDDNPPPPGGADLPGLTFGEAGINLQGAGVFPPGVCAHFGSAFLKSRSSASFPAELKDFIAPIPVNISNCGTVKIHKEDDVGTALGGAVFTLFNDLAPKASDGQTSHGAEDTATALTCTTDATTGDCEIDNVPFGDYWAVETTGVPNHELAPDQSFTITANTPDLTISLTFVDPRLPGAILITKTAKNADLGAGQHPLAGATFDVTDSNDVSVGGGTSDANGEVCVGDLTIGDTYTVTETAAPVGYDIDTASQQVTITASATCGSGDEDTVSFTDTPLTDVTVIVTSEVPGATHSTITCDFGTDGPSDPAQVDATGLAPGVYDCTIDIDP